MFWGEVGVFGGEASLLPPPPPPLDRTLISSYTYNDKPHTCLQYSMQEFPHTISQVLHRRHH